MEKKGPGEIDYRTHKSAPIYEKSYNTDDKTLPESFLEKLNSNATHTAQLLLTIYICKTAGKINNKILL